MRKHWAMVACLLAAGVAAAEPARLRLCTSDSPFYPYTMPDGSGLFQRRLQALAAEQGLVLEQRVAPRARCLQYTRTGEADALIGIFTPERLAWLAYPMREGGRPDAERGLGTARFVLYRRVGTAVQWDGQRLTGLGGLPLGVHFGYAYGARLADLQVAVDDRATTAGQLMAKLERGRVGAVLMQQEQAQQLLANAPQQGSGRIEALEPAFGTLTFYVIVTRDFQRRHGDLVERLWAAR